MQLITCLEKMQFLRLATTGLGYSTHTDPIGLEEEDTGGGLTLEALLHNFGGVRLHGPNPTGVRNATISGCRPMLPIPVVVGFFVPREIGK